MENKEEKEIKEGVNQNFDLSWVKDAVRQVHPELSQSEKDETSESVDEPNRADTLTADQPVDDQGGESVEEENEPKPTQTKAVGEEVIDEQPKVEEKMLTQSQVNKLIGKAREEGRNSALRDLLAKYGVESDSELDDMFGKGQTYDQLNADYLDLGNANKNVMAENALLKTGISPERWEDVKLILTGKGLEVSEQNISEHLATHPEWKNPAVSGEENKVLTQKDMERKVIDRSTSQGVVKNTPSVPRQLGGEVNEDDGGSTLRKTLDEIFGM